ncbi:MAG TPA: hypothetical protein VNT26_21080 [Candidatus Sulfotelmatobacter sp.]|nr:hypothetical protein [Candidatus Sulfotelmatobacter sp.]
MTALVLLVLNRHLRQPAAPVTQPAVAPAPSVATVASLSEKAALPAAAPATNAAPVSVPRPTFDWAAIEVGDYQEYVKRLKAVGFPQELIREIVIADLDKLYEPREQALKPKPVPYDAPLARRSTLDISPEEWQRIKDLRVLRVERQNALEHLLGEYVPARFSARRSRAITRPTNTLSARCRPKSATMSSGPRKEKFTPRATIRARFRTPPPSWSRSSAPARNAIRKCSMPPYHVQA